MSKLSLRSKESSGLDSPSEPIYRRKMTSNVAVMVNEVREDLWISTIVKETVT